MPKNEQSAVATLLDEINRLRERVEALEIYTWAYMARWMPRTSDVICYRWDYGDIWPRPSLDWIPEWTDTTQPIAENPIPIRDVVTTYRDDTIYAVTNDNITVPIFTPNTWDVGPRTVASCRSAYRWI